MREIKFRAWDSYTNKMIYKFMLGSDTRMGSDLWTCPLVLINEGTETQEWVNADTLEILQFTGLTDKHGVDIYEHDIVKDFSGTFVIEWSDCRHAWIIVNEDTEYYERLSKQGDLEVIGNIYEKSRDF